MWQALTNQTIETIGKCTEELPQETASFKVKVNQLILTQDFLNEDGNFENWITGLLLFVFMIGLFVFVTWFFMLGIDERATISTLALIAIPLALGVMLLSIKGSIKFIKSFSALLVRYDIQRFIKKTVRQMTNASNFLDYGYPNLTTQKEMITSKKASKDLKRLGNELNQIHELLNHYKTPLKISFRAIVPLFVSSTGLVLFIQLFAQLSNPQILPIFLSTALIVIVITVIFFLFISFRKQNLLDLFNIDDSEIKLKKSLDNFQICDW